MRSGALLAVAAVLAEVAQVHAGVAGGKIRKNIAHGVRPKDTVAISTFGYGDEGRLRVRMLDAEGLVDGDCGRVEGRTGFFRRKSEKVRSLEESEDYVSRLFTCNDTDFRETELEPVCLKPCVNQTDPECAENEWRRTADVTIGLWTLFFYNCGEKDVHLNVRVREYNLVDGRKSYLQVGDRPLPYIFIMLFFCYLCMFTLWLITMKNNKTHTHGIHYLMAALLVLKGITMLFETVKYSAFDKHGEDDEVVDIIYYIFLMLKGILLITSLLLLGSGWSFLRPCLQDSDKKLLMVVLPFQVMVNVARIVIDLRHDGQSNESWQIVLFAFDMLCFMIILLPIVLSVRSIKDAQATDGKVARNLQRLRQFRIFYAAVVAFFYLSSLATVLRTSSLSWTFLAPTAEELATLGFYLFVGMKFRPMEHNPYLSLDAEDFEEGGAALDMELQDRARDRQDLESGERSDARGGTAGAVTSRAEPRTLHHPKTVSHREDVDI